MKKCNCNIRTKLVGDGCEVCNPVKALEYAEETIREQEAEIVRLRATKAIEDVIAERQRQISAEGYSPEHDDRLIDCELSAMAAGYALCTVENYLGLNYCGAQVWPGRTLFKDDGYRRNLVKAAALALAEIERIDRKEQP